MDTTAAIADRDAFDEDAYLRRYPDIARAVAAGKMPSGWAHYKAHGAAEGRKPNDFDAAFYVRAYPQVTIDLDQGQAATPLQHYFRFGRARGYLPHPKAPRAQNPAASASLFGGLWIDQSHAADLIAGKLATGVINAGEASQLSFFHQNGYLVLPGALPKGLMNKARADLERAFDNGIDSLKFQCSALQRGDMNWQPELRTLPARVLDLHHRSVPVRQAIFAPKVTAFLELLFESKLFATQSQGFLHGVAQEAAQDSAHVVYTLPRHFVAAFAALEDVTVGAGEPFHYAGSHRFADFLYGGGSKSPAEARRLGVKEPQLNAESRAHAKSLEQRVRSAGLEKSVLAARAGDVLIRHADLVHGAHPVATEMTRKSLLTHYCPRYASPVLGEHGGIAVCEHEGHVWGSSYYTTDAAGV